MNYNKTRTKYKKVIGNTYFAKTGKILPTEFNVAVVFQRDGKTLCINNGVEKWEILVSDIKSLGV